MAGGGLKCRGDEADQEQTCHHAGHAPEPALKRRGQVKVGGLLPVHCAREDRRNAGNKRERRRHRSHGYGQSRHPFDAHEVQTREQQDQDNCGRQAGQVGQVPGLDRSSSQQGANTGRGHPAPPIATASKVREDRAVRPKGFRAAGGNAAYAFGIHQQQFDPAGNRCATQQHADHEQDNGSRALTGDALLTDQQCAENKDALIAATHGKRGRAQPAEVVRMGPDSSINSFGLRLNERSPISRDNGQGGWITM